MYLSLKTKTGHWICPESEKAWALVEEIATTINKTIAGMQHERQGFSSISYAFHLNIHYYRLVGALLELKVTLYPTKGHSMIESLDLTGNFMRF